MHLTEDVCTILNTARVQTSLNQPSICHDKGLLCNLADFIYLIEKDENILNNFVLISI